MHEGNKENVDRDPQEDDNEEYEISNIMLAVKMLKKETNWRQRITFLDFAGHTLYDAFHQIFLSPKSISILVVDMTKDFNERVKVFDTDKQCCPIKSWTYRGNYSNS